MTDSVKVVPAILTDDAGALEAMIRQAEGFTDYVQIDIMDGHFVPSRSVTVEHVAGLSIEIGWEAHLMVEKPENCLEDFKRAGASRVVFHYEAAASPEDVIARARGLGLGVGLAINPETTAADIQNLVSAVDGVLLLTVNPGFYGSRFIPEVMNKVAQLRNSLTALEIGVDGGIKESNIAEVARFGVDYICVGSAVFLQPSPAESFNHLQALAGEGRRQYQQ